MPTIEINTTIHQKKNIVFDLSRSIDLHKISAKSSNEEAISGKTSGLIGMNESVTWKAKHFGINQILTSKITEYNYPYFFTDEMQKGAFKSFKHNHYFEDLENNSTLMKDIFTYQSPLGFLGKLADTLFLKNYMENFLVERNEIIKEYAESNKWKKILNYERTNH